MVRDPGSQSPATPTRPTATPAAATTAGPAETVPSSPMASATHLVLVLTEDWSQTQGTLTSYTRSSQHAWARVGETIDIVVGQGGLGWGRGLHGDGAPAGLHDASGSSGSPAGTAGPIKVEGDGRGPAGAFRVRHAYGYARKPPAGVALPYTMVTRRWHCVDDVASPHYNQIVDATGMDITWSSSELMRRDDELYSRLAVVEHNTDSVHAGSGSCIFLHVWRDRESPTAGCTAMAASSLDRVLALAPAEGFVLVQLPRPVYTALRDAWQLP